MAVGWQQAYGSTPLVCERSLDLEREGFGFLLLPRGFQALRSLGVDPETELQGHRIDHVRLITTTGDAIGEHRFGPDTLALDRSQLLKVLRSRLDPLQLRRGLWFEDLVQADGRVTSVRFRGGEELVADLVFGADGADSRCRRALFDRQEEASMAATVARVNEFVALVPHSPLAARLGSGMLKIVEPGLGLAVGLLPLGQGRLVWYVQFDTVRYGRPLAGEWAPFLQQLLLTYPEWVREEIAMAPGVVPHLWRPLDLDPPRRLVGANVALLGDAGHPLLPFTSQGVNLALEDACLLRDLLWDCRDPEAITGALLVYEQQRLPVLRHFVEAGRSMANSFLAPGPNPGLLPVAS